MTRPGSGSDDGEDPRDRIRDLEGQLRATEARLRAAQSELRVLKDTAGHRALTRARSVLDRAAPTGTRRSGVMRAALRGLDMVQTQGILAFLRHLARPSTWTPRLSQPIHPLSTGEDLLALLADQYERWRRKYGRPLSSERIAAAVSGWPRRPSFLLVLGDQQPGPAAFRATVDSVLAQDYQDWRMYVPAGLDASGERIFTGPNRLPDRADIEAADAVCMLHPGDVLRPDALFWLAAELLAAPPGSIVYSDEARRLENSDEVPFFKPDHSPELLLSANYLEALTAYASPLVLSALKTGGFSGDYDLALRTTEMASGVHHVAKPLVTRTEPVDVNVSRDQRALLSAMARRGVPGRVEPTGAVGWYNCRLDLASQPRVSVIVPTRDRLDLLEACLDSLERRSTYADVEVVIVDNGSTAPQTLAFLEQTRHTVVHDGGDFNFSRLVNAGVAASSGEVIVLLNNDTEVIAHNWLEAMLEQAQRPDIGPVGARLVYPDGSVQHEGIVTGVEGFAGNADFSTWWHMSEVIRNCSAVTAACMMVRRSVFDEVGGFDEQLGVAWNDVDFCLRCWKAGYRVVYTPFAHLYHIGGASRGRSQGRADSSTMWSRWGAPERVRDPYYNANFDRHYLFNLRQ